MPQIQAYANEGLLSPMWAAHQAEEVTSLHFLAFTSILSLVQIELLLHFLLYMFISCLWPSRTRSRVPACFTSPPGVISAVSDFCPLPSFLRGKSPLVQTSPLGRKRRLTHDNSSRSWLSSKRLSRPKTKNQCSVNIQKTSATINSACSMENFKGLGYTKRRGGGRRRVDIRVSEYSAPAPDPPPCLCVGSVVGCIFPFSFSLFSTFHHCICLQGLIYFSHI